LEIPYGPMAHDSMTRQLVVKWYGRTMARSEFLYWPGQGGVRRRIESDLRSNGSIQHQHYTRMSLHQDVITPSSQMCMWEFCAAHPTSLAPVNIWHGVLSLRHGLSPMLGDLSTSDGFLVIKVSRETKKAIHLPNMEPNLNALPISACVRLLRSM
jgi:hypothetical protein